MKLQIPSFFICSIARAIKTLAPLALTLILGLAIPVRAQNLSASANDWQYSLDTEAASEKHLQTSGPEKNPNTKIQAPLELFQSITVDGAKIITKPGSYFLERGASQNFVVDYRDTDVDLSSLNISILSIPFIMNAAPLVFASGRTFTVDVMDFDLFYTLGNVQKTLQIFYPDNKWTGSIVPQKLKKNSINNPKENSVALFFSGGLDATAAAIGNIEKERLLITVWGRDIPLSQTIMWENVENLARGFARTYGGENAFIRSNFSTALTKIEGKLKNRNLVWWSYTTQAIGLAGLAIPLAYARNIPTLLFASSHTRDYPYPYGTHPLLDNNIECAGVKFHHEQPDLNRLDKLDLIAHVCAEKSLKKPFLRVCWGRSPKGGNCERCDKCLRTMNEIVVCGHSLKGFGFNTSLKKLALITRVHFTPKTELKSNQVWHWESIADRVRATSNRETLARSILEHQFTQWLTTIDFKSFLKNDKEQHYEWINQKDYYQNLWDAGL